MTSHVTLEQIAADLAHIALVDGGISTLEARNSDSLDFHEIAVWNLKSLLEAAYRKGAQRGYAAAIAAGAERTERLPAPPLSTSN